MLVSNMTESTSAVIDITDFPTSVVERFIEYLYKNALEPFALEAVIVELWALVDKYEVQSLRAYVENNREAMINEENVSRFVVLADQYDAKIIKESCLAFMVDTIHPLGLYEVLSGLPNHILVELMTRTYAKYLKKLDVKANDVDQASTT